jgi:hypothetical protein
MRMYFQVDHKHTEVMKKKWSKLERQYEEGLNANLVAADAKSLKQQSLGAVTDTKGVASVLALKQQSFGGVTDTTGVATVGAKANEQPSTTVNAATAKAGGRGRGQSARRASFVSAEKSAVVPPGTRQALSAEDLHAKEGNDGSPQDTNGDIARGDADVGTSGSGGGAGSVSGSGGDHGGGTAAEINTLLKEALTLKASFQICQSVGRQFIKNCEDLHEYRWAKTCETAIYHKQLVLSLDENLNSFSKKFLIMGGKSGLIAKELKTCFTTEMLTAELCKFLELHRSVETLATGNERMLEMHQTQLRMLIKPGDANRL